MTELLGTPTPLNLHLRQAPYLPHLIPGTLPVTKKFCPISPNQLLQRGIRCLRK